jgi:hypothetical protein
MAEISAILSDEPTCCFLLPRFSQLELGVGVAERHRGVDDDLPVLLAAQVYNIPKDPADFLNI